MSKSLAQAVARQAARNIGLREEMIPSGTAELLMRHMLLNKQDMTLQSAVEFCTRILDRSFV